MLPRLLVIFLCLLKPALSEEVTISWSDNKKLTWADFRGEVEQDVNAVAVTASGITFSFSVNRSNSTYVNFSTVVQAHFYPEKSWYIKAKSDDHVLAHEQLHFDITELHVRQLRYQISKLKVSQHIKQELRELHEQANIKLAKMQHTYDVESDNSINKAEQATWSQFVNTELEKYRDFRSK